MGPGVVGTGTLLGHTALEQGQILDAANALGGRSIVCLRISFADERDGIEASVTTRSRP